jgi:hypothetical protein
VYELRNGKLAPLLRMNFPGMERKAHAKQSTDA